MPMRWDTRRFFRPAGNGYLATHAVERFLAWRDGRAVGRIAVALGPGAARGSFGFLALEQDAATLRALLHAAAAWAAARGATALRGPMSLSINHEIGALLTPRPRMVRMPETPPWLPAMLEAAGCVPEQDVVARTLALAEETHSRRFHALLARWPGREALTLRRMRRGPGYTADAARFTALYNDAWAGNWGAEPVRPPEARTYASLARPLAFAGESFFACWQGQPIGIASVVPNLEEAMPRDGRLLPFAWAPLGWMLATGRARAGRLPVIGIRRAFRGHPASALALGLLLDGCIAAAKARGWRTLEVSWILDHNRRMLAACDRLGAIEDGRWRLYALSLPVTPG